MGFVAASVFPVKFETLIRAQPDKAVKPGERTMVDDPAHFLNELPIWKLKIVASAYAIDVSECRYKRDYVEKVRSKKLTEQQVRSALSKAKKDSSDAEAEAAEVRKVGKDIEQIAKRPQGAELSESQEKNVERNLDEVLAIRPSFFEVDSSSESAYNRMILGDFYGAIRLNREARVKCLETFSNAQVYSAAVSIRAGEELLSRLGDGSNTDSTLLTALAEAKRAFISGSPRQREEALEGLETLATKAYEAEVGHSERSEAELKSLLADYESFGTRTEEARRYLDIAAQAKSAFNLSDYAKFLKEARARAEGAKDTRSKEIDKSFGIVRAGAEEAKSVGADVSSAEGRFAEARKAYDAGAFRQTVEILADIERATDSAHIEQIRRQRELEQIQLRRINLTISTYEPLLTEAASYGMDVQEGLGFVSAAKTALVGRDVVRAAKFSRRVREASEPVEREIDKKRIEFGVVKRVEGARCENCGKESVYLYPNAMMKCLECGQVRNPSTAAMAQQAPTADISAPQPSFTPAGGDQQQAAQKKKRGFFKW